MLVSVTFYVGMRGDWVCWLAVLLEEKFRKKKGAVA